MKQSVITASRSGGDVIPLDQKDTQAPQGTISSGSGPCDSSSDYDDIELFHQRPVYSLIFFLRSFEMLIGMSLSDLSSHSRARSGRPLMKQPRAML